MYYCLGRDEDQILKKLNNLEKNQAQIINLLSELSKDISEIKNELKNGNNDLRVVNEYGEVLPIRPFDTMEKFLQFDQQLNEGYNTLILVSTNKFPLKERNH